MADVTAIDQRDRDETELRVQAARRSIDIIKIVARLQRCALGQLHMSKEEIKAAELLLKKGMPDLRELEVKGEVNHKHSLEELVLQSMQPQQYPDPLAPQAPTQH